MTGGMAMERYEPRAGDFDMKLIWLSSAFASFAREAEEERERHSPAYVFPQDMRSADFHRHDLCASAAILTRRVLDILSDVDGDEVADAFREVFGIDGPGFYW